jgi:hypothetical protein
MSDEEIAIEAVVAALEVVKRLKDETDISAKEVAQAVGAVGHKEMYRGLGALIYAWLQLIDEPLNLVPAVIRRVQRVGVSEEALPSVAGALVAAALGQGPDEWRFRLGPVGPSELVAWSLAASQVADFLDFQSGPGSASRITETALAPVLAGEPDVDHHPNGQM